jgi:hypothetical protein
MLPDRGAVTESPSSDPSQGGESGADPDAGPSPVGHAAADADPAKPDTDERPDNAGRPTDDHLGQPDTGDAHDLGQPAVRHPMT